MRAFVVGGAPFRWVLLGTCLALAGPSSIAPTSTLQSSNPMAAHPQLLTLAQMHEVVRATAAAYADYYVFEQKGRQIAEHLRQKLATGEFDAPANPKGFAVALTGAIHELVPDRHIEVVPPRPATSSETSGPPQSRLQRFAWLERLRKRNYDFIHADRLPGNVGLLRLDSFPPPEVAAPTAAAAMAFLKNSDALIIDLRQNGGGTGDMVRYLASYFFVEPTRLSRTFKRNANPQITYDTTLTVIPGERMPVIDVFILTSSRTFSAAEAFAFALQQRDRAEVVGEVTGGGGNAGDYIDVGHGFTAFVPDVHVSSPVSDATWEGKGVQPDIRTQASAALVTAHQEAVRRLMERATDPAVREILRRAMSEDIR